MRKANGVHVVENGCVTLSIYLSISERTGELSPRQQAVSAWLKRDSSVL
jgi:hypothetical protein